MFVSCKILPVVIVAACFIAYCISCDIDIGEPLDVEKFSGEWYVAAATPMNGSMSKCGRFWVQETGTNSFRIRFRTISTAKNRSAIFHVVGSANGRNVVGTWQLSGSRNALGPFRHVIMDPQFDSMMGMFICSYCGSAQKGYRIGMILTRERDLPMPLLLDLKHKMETYLDKRQMYLVDQYDC